MGSLSCLLLVFVFLPSALSHDERLDKILQCLAVGSAGSSGGSVYVRWGSKVCPEASQLVYSGYTGGSHYSLSGGAANYLCLPSQPQFAPYQPATIIFGPSYIYGTEYETAPEPQNDHESRCAVCWSPRSANLMIPAANTCQSGWTLEYTGFLMSGMALAGRPSSEYICVDTGLENSKQQTVVNDNQAVLYFVKAKCGSLPCPPYVEDKIVGCAVCTK